MAREGAIFGGEVTGHYYFKDFHFVDSGILPSLILVEMLSELNCSLSSALAELENTYFISGEINTPIKDASQVPTKLQQLETLFQHQAKIEKLDGLSVILENWHFNVRPSNTEPLIRLNLEATSKPLLEEKLELVLSLIQNSG